MFHRYSYLHYQHLSLIAAWPLVHSLPWFAAVWGVVCRWTDVSWGIPMLDKPADPKMRLFRVFLWLFNIFRVAS